jgi:hypothetical protein
MEKRSTFTPRRRAARKWPISWTKIDRPRRRIARAKVQRLEKTEESSSGSTGS